MIRVILPHHLQVLAQVGRDVHVDVAEPVTVDSVVAALEQQFPVLQGTIRDHTTLQRRPFIRYFACGMDISLDPTDQPLPVEITSGKDILRIVGAMAGG